MITLAIIQGITEFLPVSSSGHLILPSLLLGWPDQGLAFDVAVHVGTLAAVVLYFRKDITQLISHWALSLIGKDCTQHSRMAWYIGLATIPAVVFGLLLKMYDLNQSMRSTTVIAATTMIFGALLGFAEHFSKRITSLESMNLRCATLIGCAQVLSLIPGTSRSGITMTAALFLGFTREASARFSFLLSIPIIIGAGSLLTADLLHSHSQIDWGTMALGAFMSGICAMLCIHLFLGTINRIGLMPFVIYRLVLGVVLLLTL